MIVKREIKRNLDKYGKFLEPFMILTLILLFVIPVLSVINLAPTTGHAPTNSDLVLGAKSDEPVTVNSIGGLHNYIQNEKTIELSKSSYEYYANILLRQPGIYNKPILEITNPSSQSQEIEVILLEYENTSTQFGILINDINYVLKDSNGNINVRTFDLAPGQSETFYLDVRNDVPINFHEKIGLRVNVVSTETLDK